MAGKKNIIQEAVLETEQLRKAAMDNASIVLMEHLKENIKDFVDSQLNEAGDECETEEDTMTETEDMAEADFSFDDLDVEETSDEEETDEEVDETDDEDGLSEADLDAVLEAALQEVDHGDLGEPEEITLDNGRGLADEDTKEAGWETKTPPAKKDFTVKESILRKKIAALTKENIEYKKAHAKLRSLLEEVKLFNAKVVYTSKLIQTEGLSQNVKAKILKNMDGVKSINEAKQVYSTWMDVIGVMSETRKTSKKQTSLSEALGYNAKGGGKGANKVNADHINESAGNDVTARWAKLAGLKD